jgi:site-specific DNA-methyltransferase (adenine-specific)
VPNKKTKGLDGENIHDTEKPIELMRILIENSSKIGDYILDPFMGVGSTGMACAITNRKFIGMEIDEIYFNIAKERILNAPDIN